MPKALQAAIDIIEKCYQRFGDGGIVTIGELDTLVMLTLICCLLLAVAPG
ncbi:hypothetical protein LG290_15100 [Halomonas sediminis]